MKYMESEIMINGTPDDGVMAAFFALGIVFVTIAIIWGVAAYLLSAFALYTMARNEGREDAFLAFIPIINCKVQGDLIAKKLPSFMNPEAGWKLFGVYVGIFILSFIPIVNILTGFLSVGLGIYVMYAILERYADNAVLFTVIHVVTAGLFFPLHLFLVRKHTPRY